MEQHLNVKLSIYLYSIQQFCFKILKFMIILILLNQSLQILVSLLLWYLIFHVPYKYFNIKLSNLVNLYKFSFDFHHVNICIYHLYYIDLLRNKCKLFIFYLILNFLPLFLLLHIQYHNLHHRNIHHYSNRLLDIQFHLLPMLI